MLTAAFSGASSDWHQLIRRPPRGAASKTLTRVKNWMTRISDDEGGAWLDKLRLTAFASPMGHGWPWFTEANWIHTVVASPMGHGWLWSTKTNGVRPACEPIRLKSEVPTNQTMHTSISAHVTYRRVSPVMSLRDGTWKIIHSCHDSLHLSQGSCSTMSVVTKMVVTLISFLSLGCACSLPWEPLDVQLWSKRTSFL
jgi:hypothetical protein